MTVAAEVDDVLLNPFQSEDLIVQTLIAGGFRPVEKEKSKALQAVLHRNDDDVVRGRENASVVEIQGTGPGDERSTIDPHENGHRCCAVRLTDRKPNIQIQTILAAVGVRRPDLLRFEIVNDLFGLPAGGRKVRGVENVLPGLDALRRFETSRTDRRFGEGNAQPGAHVMETRGVRRAKVRVETANSAGVRRAKERIDDGKKGRGEINHGHEQKQSHHDD